jgi:hypothetical protein
MHQTKASLITIIYLLTVAVHAEEISWVDFSLWPAGSLSYSGLSDTNGLTLDCVFSPVSNMRTGRPVSSSGVIDDSRWPFSNNSMSTLSFISRQGTTLTTTLRIDFTSVGGLPTGGSIGIGDLELKSSAVTVIGISNEVPVAVDWAISFYQTEGVQSPPPVWDAEAKTLRGNTLPEEVHPTFNNAAFLISDSPLESVIMEITLEDGDGINISISGDTVPSSPRDTILTINSAVELEWPTIPGLVYQIQWNTNLTTNIWHNLGDPIIGDGTTYYYFDSTRHYPKRYYQIDVK